jgi:NTE family protein
MFHLRRVLKVTLLGSFIILGIRAMVPPRPYVVHAAPKTPQPVRQSAPNQLIPPPPTPDRSSVHLCLSGGGYRATLFGLGALWRLNELGALRYVNLISSASGGSILAAHLVLHWSELNFDPSTGVATNFPAIVAEPILTATSDTIDVPAITRSIFLWNSASHYIAASYDKHLFKGATLASLPKPPTAPLLYINATRLEDGALWSFSQGGLVQDDWPGAKARGELGDDGRLPLSLAVAASSAFPPILAPVRLNVASLFPQEDRLLRFYLQAPGSDDPDVLSLVRSQVHAMHAMSSRITLVDGGVRNNLATDLCTGDGLTVIVDAAVFTRDHEAGTSWPAIMYRVVNLMYDLKESGNRKLGNIANETTWNALVNLSDAQYRISSFNASRANIRRLTASAAFSDADRRAIEQRWPSSPDLDIIISRGLKAALLASASTRLKGMNREDQGHLVNVAYLIADEVMLGELLQRAYGNSITAVPASQQLPPFLPNLLSAPLRLPFPAHHCLLNTKKQCGRADFEGG